MSSNLAGSYYLTSDIDCSTTSSWNSGAGFEPIVGSSMVPFTGTFDGKGYKITGLYINRPSESYIGLFGYINGAAIKDVGLENVNITGKFNAGGLAGYSSNSSHITNSYSTGVVNGNGAGGLVGYIASSHITNSYAIVSVSSLSASAGGLVGSSASSSSITNSYSKGSVNNVNGAGGLVGLNGFSSNITSCYSTGNVSGGSTVGGLVGHNYSSSTITDSYATGSVSCPVSGSIGGLVGENGNSTITNSYSTGAISGGTVGVGGLNGFNLSTIISSYWDTQTSGLSTSTGGTGKTTAQMKTQSTFSGWDFDNIWRINEGTDYPRLKWEGVPICTGCAVLSGSVCVAGGSCSDETPNCNVSGNNGTCECSAGSCDAGRSCSSGSCSNCASSEFCGSCGCASKQKPTGSGSCANSNDCCSGECGIANSPTTCSYDDDLCPEGECNRSTLACCPSYAPYWRTSNCRACTTTSGLSGACTTKGQECNSNYNCVNCLADTQGTCDEGQIADGSGGCATPACSSNADCGIDICVNADKYNAFCSTCSESSQVWISVNNQCENCPIGSVYAVGVCACSEGKIWKSLTNTCSNLGIVTSTGNRDLKRSTASTSGSRYDNIKSKMNRIKNKLSGGIGNLVGEGGGEE